MHLWARDGVGLVRGWRVQLEPGHREHMEELGFQPRGSRNLHSGMVTR